MSLRRSIQELRNLRFGKTRLRVSTHIAGWLVIAALGAAYAPALPRPLYTTLNYEDGMVVVEANGKGLFLRFLHVPFLGKHTKWVPPGECPPRQAHRPPSGLLGMGGIVQLYVIRADNTVLPFTHEEIQSVERSPYYLKLTLKPLENARRFLEIVTIPDQATALFHYHNEGFSTYKLRVVIDGLPGKTRFPDPLAGKLHDWGEGMWEWTNDDYLMHRYGTPIDARHNPCGALFMILVSEGWAIYEGHIARIARGKFDLVSTPSTMGPTRTGENMALVEFLIQGHDDLEFGITFADSPPELVQQIELYRPAAPLAPSPAAGRPQGALGGMVGGFMEQLSAGQLPGVQHWVNYVTGIWGTYTTDIQRPIAADQGLRTNFAARVGVEELAFFKLAMVELESRRLRNGLYMARPPDRLDHGELAPWLAREQALTAAALGRMGLGEQVLKPAAQTLAAAYRMQSGPRMVSLANTAALQNEPRDGVVWAYPPRHGLVTSAALAAWKSWVEEGGTLIVAAGAEELLGDGERGAVRGQGCAALLSALGVKLDASAFSAADAGLLNGGASNASDGMTELARAGASPQGLDVAVDLTPLFADADTVYVVIEHLGGSARPVLVRDVEVRADEASGATATVRWRPNSTDESRYLAAESNASPSNNPALGTGMRMIAPGGLLAYRLRASRGAAVKVTLDLAGPYRVRAGDQAPEITAPFIASGDGGAQITAAVPRVYNPLLVRGGEFESIGRIVGRDGSAAWMRAAGKGALAFVGLPSDYFALDPNAAKVAAAVEARAAGRRARSAEQLARSRAVWHAALTDGLYEDNEPRHVSPEGLPYVIWMLHEAHKRTADPAFAAPERIGQLAAAAEELRAGDAFDSKTGLFGLVPSAENDLPRSSPIGQSVVLWQTLEFNAVWHAAYRKLEALANAARDKTTAKTAAERAAALAQAIQKHLVAADSGLYYAALAMTSEGEYERCPMEWPPLLDRTAIAVALLDDAPWNDKQRVLAAGQLLGEDVKPSPMALAALALLETPKRDVLLTRMQSAPVAEAALNEPEFVYGTLPLLRSGEVRGPHTVQLALALYAICKARAD